MRSSPQVWLNARVQGRMGRFRTVALAAALLLVPAASAHAELKAGAADADITAPVGTPMFAYTARSMLANPSHLPETAQLVADPDTNLYAKSFVPSKGIHTRVKARALVLQEGATKVALVQADLGGLPYALTQSVLQRITRTGIDGDHLLLSATHTHSSTGPIWPAGNAGYAGLGGAFFAPRIFQLTAQGIADALPRAGRQRAPARLGTATVQVTDASRNREAEMYARDPDRTPDTVNPDMTVLRVDGRDRKPIGLWSNFAIHGTSFGDGNLNFSGDNMAVTERLVQSATGGAIDVWSNADESDTSPDGDPSTRNGEREQDGATHAAKAHLAGERGAPGGPRGRRARGRGDAARLAGGGRAHDRLGGPRRAPQLPGLRRHGGRRPARRPDPRARAGRRAGGPVRPCRRHGRPGAGQEDVPGRWPAPADDLPDLDGARGPAGHRRLPERDHQADGRARDARRAREVRRRAGPRRHRRPDQRLRELHLDTRGVRRLHLRGQLHPLRPPAGRPLPRLRGRPRRSARHGRARPGRRERAAERRLRDRGHAARPPHAE